MLHGAKKESILSTGQPNNNFSFSFLIDDFTINFIKDRGYLSLEFLKNGLYTMLHPGQSCLIRMQP